MKALKLVDRDCQVMAVLAEARCLSAEQLRRLFFRAEDESVMRRRLRRLSEGKGALLRRLTWYDRSGAKHAWALTPAGYVEVERTLEREVEVPRDDIGAEYLDHHVLLTELLVRLLVVPVEAAVAKLPPALSRRERGQQLGGIYARALHPSLWRVVVTETFRGQPVGPKLELWVLRPDAVLEAPSRRRRIFVESELGTHTIVAVSASKPGATISKVERAQAFCTLMSGGASRRTWYAERFPDAMKPEVLLCAARSARHPCSAPWTRGGGLALYLLAGFVSRRSRPRPRNCCQASALAARVRELCLGALASPREVLESPRIGLAGVSTGASPVLSPAEAEGTRRLLHVGTG